MTAEDQLKELYRKKAEVGLVDVKFVFNGSAKNASVEQICQEVLNLQAAIDAGNVKPLDFGDLRLKYAPAAETDKAFEADDGWV